MDIVCNDCRALQYHLYYICHYPTWLHQPFPFLIHFSYAFYNNFVILQIYIYAVYVYAVVVLFLLVWFWMSFVGECFEMLKFGIIVIWAISMFPSFDKFGELNLACSGHRLSIIVEYLSDIDIITINIDSIDQYHYHRQQSFNNKFNFNLILQSAIQCSVHYFPNNYFGHLLFILNIYVCICVILYNIYWK